MILKNDLDSDTVELSISVLTDRGNPHIAHWAAAVISDSGFDGFSYAAVAGWV